MKVQARLLVFIQFVLFAILAVALYLLPPGQVLWARLLGIALLTLGIVLVMVSILTHQLINQRLVNVSPEPNASNQLVRTGIYAYIRHPIYAGVILTALGAALAHGHIITLLLAVIVGAFFTYKSTFEEKLLSQAYPQYADYRQQAGRFLPRLIR